MSSDGCAGQLQVLVLCPLVPGRAELLESIKIGQLGGARFWTDISFEFRSTRLSAPVWNNHHDFALTDFALFELGVDAESQGYHAVCIETVSDGALEALRAALRIPVIGAAQAAYHTALLLGNRFSVLVVWDGFRLVHQRSLRLHGLTDRCASIRDLGMPSDDVNFTDMFGGREELYYPKLLESALRAVEEDGAEVIVLGSTTMYKARPYLAERLPVPVIDPATAMYKQVETILALGLTHSPVAYSPAPDVLGGVAHAMVDAVDELAAR